MKILMKSLRILSIFTVMAFPIMVLSGEASAMTAGQYSSQGEGNYTTSTGSSNNHVDDYASRSSGVFNGDGEYQERLFDGRGRGVFGAY